MQIHLMFILFYCNMYSYNTSVQNNKKKKKKNATVFIIEFIVTVLHSWFILQKHLFPYKNMKINSCLQNIDKYTEMDFFLYLRIIFKAI